MVGVPDDVSGRGPPVPPPTVFLCRVPSAAAAAAAAAAQTVHQVVEQVTGEEHVDPGVAAGVEAGQQHGDDEGHVCRDTQEVKNKMR